MFGPATCVVALTDRRQRSSRASRRGRAVARRPAGRRRGVDRAGAFLDTASHKRMSVGMMVDLRFKECVPNRAAPPKEWSALESDSHLSRRTDQAPGYGS